MSRIMDQRMTRKDFIKYLGAIVLGLLFASKIDIFKKNEDMLDGAITIKEC